MSHHRTSDRRKRSRFVWESFFVVLALLASVGLGGSQSFAAGSPKVEPIPIVGKACSKKGDYSANGLFCERTNGLNKWTNPVLKPGTYKIGYPAVITGAQALVGISEARGVRLAVEEINKTKLLGPGVKLELVETDTGGDSGKVIGAINEFSVKKVSGIVCCLLSAMSGVAKPIVIGKKLPMVIPTSLLPSLPQLPYIYRPQIMLGKPGGTYSQLIIELVKSYKLEKVVIVQTADSAAVAGESLVWQASAVTAGLEVLAMVNTLIADTDYSGAASQAIAKNPDAIFVSMNSGSAARFVRSVRERGYKGVIASGFSISDPSLASLGGSSLAETIFPTPFFYNNPLNAEAKMIFEKFKKRYMEEASYFTGMGYTAVKFLAMGIKLSGNGKPEDVSKALARITRFESPYGIMVMVNGQGDYARLQGPTIAKWTKSGTQVVWIKPKS